MKKAQIKKSGNSFRLKILLSGKLGLINVVPPNPGAQADTNFSFGGGAEYCSSTVGAAIGPNDAKTFKAKDALAPAACNIPACSP